MDRYASLGAQRYTDDTRTHKGADRRNETVRHSVGEYVRGMAHTNSVESFWATLKRAHKGTFHRLSAKHLQRHGVRATKVRPNFRNRTVWTGDNLDILRGINSESVELLSQRRHLQEQRTMKPQHQDGPAGITRRDIADHVRAAVERGEFTFGPEPRIVEVRIGGEAFNVRGWDALYPPPPVPLDPMDLPGRALVEHEFDELEREFMALERGA